MPPEGAGQEGEGRGVAPEERFEPRGVRSAEGPPGVARQQLLPLVDPLAAGEERGHLGRVELAQAMKGDDARVLADADQRQLRAPQVAARETVEHADQQELIEQVMLEPEDDLVKRAVVLQDVVPAGEVGEGRVVVRVAALGEVAGAHLAPALRRQPARHRPLVQHVRGDGHLAGDLGEPDRLGRDVAVGHVEHAPRRDRTDRLGGRGRKSEAELPHQGGGGQRLGIGHGGDRPCCPF